MGKAKGKAGERELCERRRERAVTINDVVEKTGNEVTRRCMRQMRVCDL